MLLSTPFWRDQADFQGKLGPITIDGVSYGGTIVIKKAEDNIAAGN